MQDFVIEDRSDRDLVGDFLLKPRDDYKPTDVEQAYVKRLHAALDRLAQDAAADEMEPAPPSVLDARREARQTAVASFRSDAASTLTAEAASENVGHIGQKYDFDLSRMGSGPNARFEIKDEETRFPGYFEIKTNFWPWFPGAAGAEDNKYVAEVKRLLNSLHDSAINDQESLDANSPRMREHVAARQGAADDLKRAAGYASSYGITLKESAAALRKIVEAYETEIGRIDKPKFKIEDRESKPRFQGDFKINVDEESGPTRDHDLYAKQVREILQQLAADEAADENSGDADSVIARRKELRKNAAETLKRAANDVSMGRMEVIAAGNAASTTKGKYLRELELESVTLFTIEPEHGESGLAVGIKIKVARNLPPPNNIASVEKQDLYTAILAAQTVIMTVCNRIKNGEDKTLCGRAFAKQPNDTADQRADLLRHDYLMKLVGIGQLGLQGPNTTLAMVALDSMRNEFVAQEGPRIKNSYVCRLGLACGIAAAIFLLAYVLITLDVVRADFWRHHKTFFLAGTGAAIGTWLSFSIREVELSFDRLGVVEADLLDPVFRVLFVVALTITACLLFWTGVMNVEIGNLKTTSGEFRKMGTIALLVGLFCGLSERALATSVSGRAATFVKAIAG
jgi:hypothetical protein